MKVSSRAIEVLQKRLKNVDESTESKDLRKLANAISMMSKLETTEDILEISRIKLREIADYGDKYVGEIHSGGDLELASLESDGRIATDLTGYKQDNLETIARLSNDKQGEIEDIVEHFRINIPENSSICSEIDAKLESYKFLKPKDLPFIFGILSRYDDYYNGFTSELGSWYNSNADIMFGLLAGCHNYTTQYAGFYTEPKLCFLQGLRGNFSKKKSYIKYQYTSTQYSYPYAAIGCLFVKNTTSSSITSTINFGGTNYSSSGGSAMFVGTPSSGTISWTNVYSYSSSSSGFSNSASITIPAKTTGCVLFYTSSFYNTTPSSTSYHAQFLQWRLTDIRSGFLVNGLEIDLEKTLKAWQCKGSANIYSIWE